MTQTAKANSKSINLILTIYIKYLTIVLALIQLMSCKTLDTLDAEKSKYTIIKEAKGDLNLDGITDTAILTLKENSVKGKIIILISNSDGRVSQKLVNEHLTDGFVELYNELPELEIKNGALIISYYGGMCYREFRDIQFKFNKNLNNLYFDSSRLGGHNVCNDSEYETEFYSGNEQKKITFEQYRDSI